MMNSNKIGVLLLAFVAAAAIACGDDDGGSGGSGGSGSTSSSSGSSSSSSSSGGGEGGGGEGGKGGAGGQGGGGEGGSAPGASFADVQSQVLTSCQSASCHGAAPFHGGLDLTPENAYAQLVDVQARNPAGGVRVTPGDADASFLYNKLVGELSPAQGGAMPLGQAQLSQEKLDLVKEWIEAGANP